MSDNGATARRFQVRMTSGLVLCFGTLVLLAVGLVLWLGLWSTRANTLELTRAQADVTLALLRTRIGAELRPAADAVEGFATQIERGELRLDDMTTLQAVMRGVMHGASQLSALLYITPDGRTARMLRNPSGLQFAMIDISQEAAAGRLLADIGDRADTHWGEVVRPQEANVSVINVRRAVRRDGELQGVAVATVVIDTLSRGLDDIGADLGGMPFVLDAAERVVAHHALRDGYSRSTPDRPLPTADELGDPVLAAFVDPGQRMSGGGRFARNTGVALVQTAAGDTYAVLAAPIPGFAALPWRAGVYYPIEEVDDAFLRLLWASVAGVVVLLLALLVAWRLARYLARPVLALAAAAIEVRDLRLGEVQPLGGSLFRELNDAGSAFNAMVVGLRWFEFYVPRQLVHRLVRQGEAATRSEAREVTVLFSDLAGFTTMSEDLDATATADLLNGHFALLAACVEAEGGTIDKFIGDGLMAFWGAPEPQSDHAARAVRAALAIRDALAGFNAERATAGLPPLVLRIGLHSGPVVVGNIGAPGRINYTIVGDTVNVAARLEQLGKEVDARSADRGTCIIASADTVAAAGIDAAPAGSQPIRGRHGEVALCRL